MLGISNWALVTGALATSVVRHVAGVRDKSYNTLGLDIIDGAAGISWVQ